MANEFRACGQSAQMCDVTSYRHPARPCRSNGNMTSQVQPVGNETVETYEFAMKSTASKKRWWAGS
jgi:hypothetical protein